MENPSQKPNLANKDNSPKGEKNRAKYMAYELATEFAFLIAVPLIGFLLLGKWLDAKYHQKFFVFIGLFLALATSSIAIGKRINRIRRDLK